MREIKFRAWDNENKEMLKVQELDFEDTFYGGRLAIRTDQYNDYFDLEDMILMQFTGLKDKNGKEIYDGDIVKNSFYLEHKFEVCWKECSWYLKNVKTSEYIRLEEIFSLRPHYDLEIIGNIYDNPELLEKGE